MSAPKSGEAALATARQPAAREARLRILTLTTRVCGHAGNWSWALRHLGQYKHLWSSAPYPLVPFLPRPKCTRMRLISPYLYCWKKFGAWPHLPGVRSSPAPFRVGGLLQVLTVTHTAAPPWDRLWRRGGRGGSWPGARLPSARQKRLQKWEHPWDEYRKAVRRARV
jgi:hypothetical protein